MYVGQPLHIFADCEVEPRPDSELSMHVRWIPFQAAFIHLWCCIFLDEPRVLSLRDGDIHILCAEVFRCVTNPHLSMLCKEASPSSC